MPQIEPVAESPPFPVFSPGPEESDPVAGPAVTAEAAARAAAINAHLGDALDAHDAAAVSVAAISGLSATDAQAALVELREQVQTVESRRLDQVPAPTAAVALNAQKITGLADPTSPQDASTRAFVLATRDALLASPALTGSPTAPTQAVGDATTKLATGAAVQAEVTLDRARLTLLEARQVDPRTLGAIADGTSRTLASLGYTLAAAQAAFGAHVVATSDELDWAVVQKVANSGVATVLLKGHYITNRLITPMNDQEYVIPPGSIVENILPRNTPSTNQVQASVFELGNMHPVIAGGSDAGYMWGIHDLAAITSGDKSITVSTPAGVTEPFTVGDIVFIRSNNTPEAVGVGLSYDFGMWNKVTSWNSSTGVVGLELPVPVTIAPTGSASTLFGPKLLINAGTDAFRGTGWWVAQNVHIHGGGKLIGLSPTGIRSAGWRCRVHDLELDVQHLINSNAMALSRFENLSGYWSERFMEIKQVSQGSTYRNIRGVYKPDATITPKTPLTIGEQSYGLIVKPFSLEIGRDFTANLRAFEIYSPDNLVDGEIYHYGTGGHAEAYSVKTSSQVARPPADLDLRLKIRAGAGLTQYGLIGGGGTGGEPTRVKLTLDQRTDGAAPTYALRVNRGTKIDVATWISDVPYATAVSPGESATGIPQLLATVAGPVTYAAGTDTFVGGASVALRGVRVGDVVQVGLQQIGAASAGVFGSLFATATVAASDTVSVYIRDRSAVDVTIAGPTALWITGIWRRGR